MSWTSWWYYEDNHIPEIVFASFAFAALLVFTVLYCNDRNLEQACERDCKLSGYTSSMVFPDGCYCSDVPWVKAPK